MSEVDEARLLDDDGDDGESGEDADSSSGAGEESERVTRRWVVNRETTEEFAAEALTMTHSAVGTLLQAIAEQRDPAVRAAVTRARQFTASPQFAAILAQRRRRQFLRIAKCIAAVVACLWLLWSVAGLRCLFVATPQIAAASGCRMLALHEVVAGRVSASELLHPAAGAGDAVLVQELLYKHNADPRTRSALNRDETPLHAAARSGSEVVLQVLLRTPAVLDVNSRSSEGLTPLQLATTSHAIAILKRHGAEIPPASV